MTDNDAWIIQVSPKLPDGTLINIRGKSDFAFKDALKLAEDTAGDIARVIALFSGTQTLANAGVTGQTAPAQPAPQAPASQPQQQAAPAAQSTPVPQCAHGPRKHHRGTNARGEWQAFFCPAPKGDPTQCKAQFLNQGDPGWVY